ncbi:MAG: hypothetical protein AABW47_04010 [Nanoarchaeota archaeon]
MNINSLLLTKEELPILHNGCFQIPIHPKLLDSNLRINPLIAKNIFSKVAEEYRADLTEYASQEKDIAKREWYENVFLKDRKVVKKNNQQFFGIWEDEIKLSDNGLVIGFSISRNAGGSLYFAENENSCIGIIPNCMIKFTPDKAREFEIGYGGGGISSAFVYSSHNIDDYPGALFLRNWAIEYMNEVFRELE